MLMCQMGGEPTLKIPPAPLHPILTSLEKVIHGKVCSIGAKVRAVVSL